MPNTIARKKRKKVKDVPISIRWRDRKVLRNVKRAAEHLDVSFNKFVVKAAITTANTVLHQAGLPIEE